MCDRLVIDRSACRQAIFEDVCRPPHFLKSKGNGPCLGRHVASRGFTLMEVLVVLVLAGMIGTILMQGLTYVFNLRVRFLGRIEEQAADLLQSHWIKKVIAGLAPCLPEEGAAFTGKAMRFTGLTLAPLQGDPGVMTPFTMEWLIENQDIILRYSEGKDKPLELGRWKGGTGNDEAAGFSYLDDQGSWHRQWPPGMDVFSQLPQAILLEMRAVRGPVAWLVRMAGRHDPKPVVAVSF